MRTTRKVQVESVEVVSASCDRCGRELIIAARPPPTPPGGLEPLEGMVIRYTGGFYSRHVGDSSTVRRDVCEKCLMDWFQGFLRPPPPGDEEDELDSLGSEEGPATVPLDES